MNDVEHSFSESVQRRIDEHLDAIDRVLIDKNMMRSERRLIVEDVESQIIEMI